jgi:hypothetical protein
VPRSGLTASPWTVERGSPGRPGRCEADAGKTTAAQPRAGLVRPSTAEVAVFGEPPRVGRRDVGYVIARDGLLPVAHGPSERRTRPGGAGLGAACPAGRGGEPPRPRAPLFGPRHVPGRALTGDAPTGCAGEGRWPPTRALILMERTVRRPRRADPYLRAQRLPRHLGPRA